ncbi:OmpP1/FadL family transporter [Geothermobacter hydrogeniphilus]|uniref:Aromatic hydrocarbon degradation protein n=1 Tax=Geothermobacter hydrogeniphilus TaxID=1969733 RepID=A0A1X0YDP9_9BACT|nr:outer membrane protein transport protein [Geothermobacter hydrogeniphilus]ORJ63325.1 aromatic hydrocarbon degradation protein [Geothermobacter hydrogeniphilus]
MKKVYLLLILLFGNVGDLQASGFGVFTQGAAGLGQGNAVVAHSPGPSSLYFNPALLTEVPGTRVEAGTTLVYADRDFTSDLTGNREPGDDALQFPSTFYATHQFDDRWSAGLGLFFPFGLATEWDESWEGRYIATRSDLFTFNINPVLACRLSDRVSIAAGLDVLYLDAELERQINSTGLGIILNPPGGFGPLTDAGQQFSGDGWGVGYNIGLFVRVSDRVNFGATFRSHIDVDVDGNLNFSIPPDAAMLASVLTDTSGHADVRLPRQATFGLAWEASGQLTLEVGGRWEDWSSTDELRVDLDQPVLGQSSDVMPRDWDDTWAFNIGGEYQLNDTVALRAGYLYSDNPVPASTFDPSVPDADAQLLTLGAGFSLDRWTLDLAYGFEHHRSRNKNNAVGASTGFAANGKYSTDLHLVAASLAYQF